MDRLLFGVSGLPLGDRSKKFNYATGVAHLARIGLEAMELLFVRSVNVNAGNAPVIREAARRFGVRLSAHGSYYVNLNARDEAVREKSLSRLREAAAALRLAGAQKLVFHPGYYLGADSAAAGAAVSANLARLADAGVLLCLETTGKPTQFGSLEELLALCREHAHCRLCIDFAHIHARGNGALKGYADFADILERVERALGRAALDDLHMHVAGIRYGAKGERRHLPLLESDFPYLNLLRALRDFRVAGTVIAEGPLVEGDALRLKAAWRNL